MNVGDYQSEISKYMRFSPKRKEQDEAGPTGTAMDPWLTNSSDLASKGRSYASQHTGGYGAAVSTASTDPTKPAEAPPEEKVVEAEPIVAAVDTATEANPAPPEEKNPWMTPEIEAAGKLNTVSVDEKKFLRQQKEQARRDANRVPGSVDDPHLQYRNELSKKYGADKAWEEVAKPRSAFWKIMAPTDIQNAQDNAKIQRAHALQAKVDREYEAYLKVQPQAGSDDRMFTVEEVDDPNTPGGKIKTKVYSSGRTETLGSNTPSKTSRAAGRWTDAVDSEGVMIARNAETQEIKPYIKNSYEVEGPPVEGAPAPTRDEYWMAPKPAPTRIGNDLVTRTGERVYDGPDTPKAPGDPGSMTVTERLKAVARAKAAGAAAEAAERDPNKKKAAYAAAYSAALNEGAAAPAAGGAAPPVGTGAPAQITLPSGARATVRRKG